MNADRTIFVDCTRDGALIWTYDFLVPGAIGPNTPPSDEDLIKQAKENLSSQGLAAPPFDGIKFRVRRAA
jgi:hypothetical protein